MFRKICTILLLELWLLMGTGALAHLHSLQHRLEDACCQTSGSQHDDRNCPIHAQLHAPIIAVDMPLSPVGPFQLLGKLTAVPCESFSQASQQILSCRDPPAMSL